MRLGVFIPYGSTPTNGQGMYQDGLLEGLLAQQQHQVVVLRSDREAATVVPDPHEVVRIAHPRRRMFSALSVDLFAEGAAMLAARRARLDALVGIGQSAMPRPPGVPRIVVLFEAAFLESSPWGTYPALTLRQYVTTARRNMRSAAAVVCLSEHGCDQIARGFGVPSDRLIIAPPSLRPFPPLDRSRYRPAGNYVLVVGWFHPRKDVTLALRSWRRAVERGLDADLVLAGTEGPPDRRQGTMGRRVLDAVGAALADRVFFTGTIPRDELGALYRDASALLMTSLHEGFGIPAIEAFSMGVPVVAVRRTSLTEVVGPAGVVADAEPDALATALLDVCAQRGDDAARRAYAATFTVERQVAPIFAIADRLSAG